MISSLIKKKKLEFLFVNKYLREMTEHLKELR